jgi:hypothetical protein
MFACYLEIVVFPKWWWWKKNVNSSIICLNLVEDLHFLIPCVRNYSKFFITPLFLQIYRFGIELGSSLDPWDLKFFFMKNFWNNNGNFDCSCVCVDTIMHIWESVSLHYLLLDSCNMWVVWYLFIWP